MYYIITEQKVTGNKVLVEAPSRGQAVGLYLNGNGEWIGEIETADTTKVSARSFETREEALASTEAAVI